MNCKDFKELIEAYFENGLDPMNDEEIKKHISSCKKCEDYFRFHSQYLREVRKFRKRTAPAGFTESVEEKLAERSVKREPFSLSDMVNFFRKRFSVEAFALAGLALIMVIVYKPFTVKETSVSETDLVRKNVIEESVESYKKDKPLEERIISKVKKTEKPHTEKKAKAKRNIIIAEDNIVADDLAAGSEIKEDPSVIKKSESGVKADKEKSESDDLISQAEERESVKEDKSAAKKSDMRKRSYSLSKEKISTKNSILEISRKHGAIKISSKTLSDGWIRYTYSLKTENIVNFINDLVKIYEIRPVDKTDKDKKSVIIIELKKK